MASKKCTPEFKTLEEYLPKICDALTFSPVDITPLANDLCSNEMISSSTRSAVTVESVAPSQRANDLMVAAMGTVKQDPSKFEDLLQKLKDHDLRRIAKKMEGQCDLLGRSKADTDNGDKATSRKGKSSKKPARESLKGRKILVVGHNGSGKSSVINELLARPAACVGEAHTSTKHKSLEEYTCTVDGIEVAILDTRGFGDPEVKNDDTMKAIKKIKSEVGVVIICHKLYDRIDQHTTEELQMIVKGMGNDLIGMSVLVFTFGDEYKTKHEDDDDVEYTDTRCRKLTDESKEVIKIQMTRQKVEMEHLFRKAFQNCGIHKEITDKIPSCISCGKRYKDGTERELPTSDNWVVDLWGLCADRCKPEAKTYIGSIKERVFGFIASGYEIGVIGAQALHSVITSPLTRPFVLAAATALKKLIPGKN